MYESYYFILSQRFIWCNQNDEQEFETHPSMCVSEMDQLLLDAKRLASRLRDHNGSSDALIGQANNLHFKLDAMKQVRM